MRAPWLDRVARLPWQKPGSSDDDQSLYKRVFGIFAGQ
jgi:hypothetical protein